MRLIVGPGYFLLVSFRCNLCETVPVLRSMHIRENFTQSGSFFLPPPQKKSTRRQNFLDVPIKPLKCFDIIFLSQFDVPEHVSNVISIFYKLLRPIIAFGGREKRKIVYFGPLRFYKGK